jgi:hypothetical protein
VSLTKRDQDGQQQAELKETLRKFVQLCVEVSDVLTTNTLPYIKSVLGQVFRLDSRLLRKGPLGCPETSIKITTRWVITHNSSVLVTRRIAAILSTGVTTWGIYKRISHATRPN